MLECHSRRHDTFEVHAGAALPLYLVKGSYNTLLGPAITGLIAGLPFIVLAVILLVKVGNKTTLDKKGAHWQEDGQLN